MWALRDRESRKIPDHVLHNQSYQEIKDKYIIVHRKQKSVVLLDNFFLFLFRCLESNTLFVDPTFPPNSTSMGDSGWKYRSKTFFFQFSDCKF